MKRLLLRLLPARAAAQIAVIVVGSLILANLVTAVVLLIALPRELRRGPPFPYIVELVALGRQVHAAPTPEAKRTVIEAALAAQPRLALLARGTRASEDPGPWPQRIVLEGLREDFRGVAEVLALDSAGPGPPPLALRFADGTGLALTPPPMTPPQRGFAFVMFLIVMLASLATLVALLSLWATRAVVAPLSRLAAAADGFDPDRPSEIAVDRGPVEVTRLAAAFSAMAARIRRLVDDRTRMLAAVSHDLRTPITRLRLRAEEIDDAGLRQPILADLALMERMVGGALSFLRDGRASGSMAATDVAAMLQTICDDFSDLGHAVVYDGPDKAAARCDCDQIARAVTNLVDNAIKFGERAIVGLDAGDPHLIAISVADDGPGIAAPERDKVLEPFYRSDVARTLREGDGFGLGLAIVKAIADAHRGSLSLETSASGGLLATLRWPRA